MQGRYPRDSNSITRCPRCGGASQIEDTSKADTHYVRRTRACTKCGATWGTAEIPVADIKKIKALDKLLKDLRV